MWAFAVKCHKKIFRKMIGFIFILIAPPAVLLVLGRVRVIQHGIPILWACLAFSWIIALVAASPTLVQAYAHIYGGSRITATSRIDLPDVPYRDLIEKHSVKNGLDPLLVTALVKQESAFNPGAVSHAGAMGLGQLMPPTARHLGVVNAFNPDENLDGATRHLAYLIERYNGSWPLALAAYNAGEGRVNRCMCVPAITETQTYVKKVLGYYAHYAGVVLPYQERSLSLYQSFSNGYHGPSPWGRDYVSPCGTPLYNPLPGATVARMGMDGLGNTYIALVAGKLEVIMLHGDYVVSPGMQLGWGDVVGFEATYGNSDRCHTHFSLIVDGREIDPALAGLE